MDVLFLQPNKYNITSDSTVQEARDLTDGNAHIGLLSENVFCAKYDDDKKTKEMVTPLLDMADDITENPPEFRCLELFNGDGILLMEHAFVGRFIPADLMKKRNGRLHQDEMLGYRNEILEACKNRELISVYSPRF